MWAGRQGDLFRGVHLPDLMSPPGPSGVGSGPPPRRRGGEIGPEEPTLERAFGGERDFGELVAQDHTDQSRPPGRMFPAEAEGRLHEREAKRRRAQQIGEPEPDSP